MPNDDMPPILAEYEQIVSDLTGTHIYLKRLYPSRNCTQMIFEELVNAVRMRDIYRQIWIDSTKVEG